MKKLIFSSLIAVLLPSLCLNKAIAQENNNVYSFVSMKQPPAYPGGIAEFYKFLGEQIKYPAAAVKDNVQGNVFASFIVEEDGSLTDIKIDRKLGAGTDEEAIRVLKSSKPWNPGMLDGKPVRVKYNIPIKFALNKASAMKPASSAIPSSTGNVVDQAVASSTTNDQDHNVYNFVTLEQPPTYPGGMNALYQFMGSNIKYPTMAIKNKTEGNVFLSFTIEEDGTLSDLKVDRKLGSGTDEEALRVLKLAGAWNPGMQNGKTVRVKYNLPVKFSLSR